MLITMKRTYLFLLKTIDPQIGEVDATLADEIIDAQGGTVIRN
ncbi:hypothetical protein OK016_15270 [Vibrio chagasii]|nr:hypothetical protein [Vibrio chagasii]